MSGTREVLDRHDLEPATPAFRVLFVCTANHCRSPLAEFIALDEIEGRDIDWSVSSAGIRARPGRPMHDRVAHTVRGLGFDPTDWTATRLDTDLVDRSDLILTAGEEHRGVVARLRPAAMARTFTLLQFAHLTRAVDAAELPAVGYGPELLARVTALRGQVQPMAVKDRDIPDPMGQSALAFRRCRITVQRAVEQIVRLAPRQRWTTAPAAVQQPRRAADGAPAVVPSSAGRSPAETAG